MAIDNSLYDSLESTYMKIKDYLDNTQLGREHSAMIMKQEELAEILATFDIEAIEEQSKDIESLHRQLNEIKEVSTQIPIDLMESADSTSMADKVVSGLDKIFLSLNNIVI